MNTFITPSYVLFRTREGAGSLVVGSSAHQSLLPYILHRSTLILDIPLSVPPTRSVSSRARPYCLLFPKIFLPWRFKLFPAIDCRFVGLSFASRSLLLGCFPCYSIFPTFLHFRHFLHVTSKLAIWSLHSSFACSLLLLLLLPLNCSLSFLCLT